MLIAVFLYVELDINPFVVEDAVPNSPPTIDISPLIKGISSLIEYADSVPSF